MPLVNEYQLLNLEGFAGGMNKHADSSSLEPDELAEATNVRLGPRGEIRKRTGYERYDLNLTDSVSFVKPWRNASGADRLFVVQSDGEIWADALDQTFTTGGYDANIVKTIEDFGVGFAGAGNKMFISSKTMTHSVVTYTGSTWNVSVNVPKAKHLIYRHNRLFAINTQANPSRIFYSHITSEGVIEIENFQTGTDFIDVTPDDGYQINQAHQFGDDIVLFKDKAMWKLSGRTPSGFSLYRIDNHRGSVSPRAIAELRGRLVFYDRDTGIWAFDGTNLELISQPINDFLLAGLDYDNAFLASMYEGHDRVYCSIPWIAEGGGPTQRTFVYHGDVGSWTMYDTGFGGSETYLNRRFVGLAGLEGLYEADISENELVPGTPIDASFRTGWFLLGGPGVKARVRRLELQWKSYAPGGDATIVMYRDYDEDTPYVTRTIDIQAGVFAQALLDDPVEKRLTLDGWGNRVHAVQFQISGSLGIAQISRMSILYTGGVDVRGERL